jgi:tetratricopeptide (TPR) repeat protein
VTAQLINVTDGFHLWSQRYDRDMNDVFEIQDEISAAIVSTVKGKLVVQDAPLVRQGTSNMEAYRSYLRGRHHWYQRDLQQAIVFFEQAVAQDPNYALPYCGLADTYSAFGLFGLIPTGLAYQRAKAMVDRALVADNTLAEVHYSRGLIEFFFRWGLEEAIDAFREAIERNPRLAAANAYLCAVTGMVGDEVTALEAGPRAQELEPLSPLINASSSMGYYLLGHLELTELACQQAVAIDPGQNTAQYLLGLARAGQGRYDEAIEVLEQTAERMRRIPHILMFLGQVLWKSGRHAAAKQVLAETYETSARGVDRPGAKTWLHMHMGELDAGFDQLELAIAARDPAVPFLLSWPGLAPMRADPRYDQILERLDLAQYAASWHKRSS